MSDEVVRKLQLRSGDVLWVDAPAELLALFVPLPGGVESTDTASSASVLVAFVQGTVDVEAFGALHRPAFASARMVWIAYRKGDVGDLNRDSLAALAGTFGLEPVRQIALDDAWSALRFTSGDVVS